MTRENKLALVVGFGLILFVGILISDHFSIVRTQQAADLTTAAITDPLAQYSAANPQLIDLQQIVAPIPAVSPATMETSPAIEQIRPVHELAAPAHAHPEITPAPPAEPVRRVQSPASSPPAGFVEVAPEPTPIPVNVLLHAVSGGESLYSICRKHYGDTSLVNALAKFNNIDEPTSLKVGQAIQLPLAEVIGGKSKPVTPTLKPKLNGTTNPAATETPKVHPPSLKIIKETTTGAMAKTALPKKPAGQSTYTVKSGDSLAVIAQRFLGSRSKWKKIYDLNRNIIDDPDNVKVGTVLRLL